jgi:hypothetical protein
MTTPDSLRRLEIAARLHFERELSGVRRIDDATIRLRSEAAALMDAQADGNDLLAMRGIVAGLSRSWEMLRERRLLEIRDELAELAAQREDARRRVAWACGRVEAIGRLASRNGR